MGARRLISINDLNEIEEGRISMKARKVLSLLTAVMVAMAMMPAMVFADTAADAAPAKSKDIVILATSDVHCGLEDNIGYAGLAAYRNAMKDKYENVALVDAGDAVQGDVVGTLSKGTYIRDILNEMKYDVLVPGNHEFDYGMDQFLKELAGKSTAGYISCNFVDKSGKTVFNPYKIMTFGDKKVAFVGICTPETFTKSTPTFFQDKDGNYIYGFCEGDSGRDLYKAVQTAVDAAKAEGANYVIAVGHLGNDKSATPWTSQEVLGNTTGIDVFVDGHAHSTGVEAVKTKDGKSVQVLSTGTKLANIGKVVISTDGKITASNVSKEEATAKDETIDKFVKKIIAKNEETTKKVVAKSTVKLSCNDENGNRLVRKQETNIGDFCADAYKVVLGADIGFIQGGGIRADINVGDVSYGDFIKVHPWSNKGCVIEATGQQIIDALEHASQDVGTAERGGFLQVAGVTYEINPFVKNSVVVDEKGMFVRVDGERRVSNVKVNGQDIELTKTYTVASSQYILKEKGDGFAMFDGCKVVKDEVKVDNELLIDYATENLKGTIGEEYAKPQGRIVIKKADDAIGDIQKELDAANKKLDETNAALAATKAKLAVAEFDCKVKASNKKAYSQVSWNKCKAAGVKYQVYSATKSGGKYKLVTTTSKTAYKNTKIAKGKKVYYKVRAVKTVDGKKYYGHWSNSVMCKKLA